MSEFEIKEYEYECCICGEKLEAFYALIPYDLEHAMCRDHAWMLKGYLICYFGADQVKGIPLADLVEAMKKFIEEVKKFQLK